MKRNTVWILIILSVILLTCRAGDLFAREIHISPIGNDSSKGDLKNPYRTVNKAASIAVAGDVVIIHDGVYRERVSPQNSGKKNNPIVYKSAGDGEVILKGSNHYYNFFKVKGSVWKCTLDSKHFYDGWNPYNVLQIKKRKRTCGAIYRNGKLLEEVDNIKSVYSKKHSWKANKSGTEVYVNLGGANPNQENIEIAMRAEIFAPSTGMYNKIHYITIKDIAFSHTGSLFHSQFNLRGKSPITGALNIPAGHHWIVENCRFIDVKTAGIGTGCVSNETYRKKRTTKIKGGVYANLQAGHNVFRGNLFKNCGSNGIIAAWDCFSEVIGNRFINCNSLMFPIFNKTGGIKMMFCFDWLIRDNYFKDNKGNSLWIDWTNTGCRVTGNVFKGDRFWYEASHGPILVDNNVFLDAYFKVSDASGIRAVHNLFYNTEIKVKKWKNRPNSFFYPHKAIRQNRKPELCDIANNIFYNNIWINGKIEIPEENKKIPKTIKVFYDNRSDYNVFLQKANKSHLDNNSVVSAFDTNFKYLSTENEVGIEFALDNSPWKVNTILIKNSTTGPTPKQNQSIDVVIETDYFGMRRNLDRPLPGSFSKISEGKNFFTVWPKNSENKH